MKTNGGRIMVKASLWKRCGVLVLVVTLALATGKAVFAKEYEMEDTIGAGWNTEGEPVTITYSNEPIRWETVESFFNYPEEVSIPVFPEGTTLSISKMGGGKLESEIAKITIACFVYDYEPYGDKHFNDNKLHTRGFEGRYYGLDSEGNCIDLAYDDNCVPVELFLSETGELIDSKGEPFRLEKYNKYVEKFDNLYNSSSFLVYYVRISLKNTVSIGSHIGEFSVDDISSSVSLEEKNIPIEQISEAVNQLLVAENVSADAIAYTVQAGDSWGTLALNYYGSYAYHKALQEANKGLSKQTGGRLTAGMELILPERLGSAARMSIPTAGAGEKLYTVKAGDTLGKIAKGEYGTSKHSQAIFERNQDRLKNVNIIYEGQILILPASSAS